MCRFPFIALGQVPKEYRILKCHPEALPSVGPPSHPEDLLCITLKAQTERYGIGRGWWGFCLQGLYHPQKPVYRTEASFSSGLLYVLSILVPQAWERIERDYSIESPKSLQVQRLLLHLVLPVFLRILSHLGFYSPFYPCED